MLKGATVNAATLAANGLATVIAPTTHQTTVGQVGGTVTIGTVQDLDTSSSPVFAQVQAALVNKNAAISVALSANAGSGASVVSTNVKSGLPKAAFQITVGTGPAAGVQGTITFNNGVTLDGSGTLGVIGWVWFVNHATGVPVMGDVTYASSTTATFSALAALTAGATYDVRCDISISTV